MKFNKDSSDIIDDVEVENESKTTTTCYSWGVDESNNIRSTETKKDQNQQYSKLQCENEKSSSSLIIEDVTDEVDTLQLE